MKLTFLSSKTQSYQSFTHFKNVDKVTLSCPVSKVGLALTEKPGSSLLVSFDKAFLLLLFTFTVRHHKGEF